MDEKKKYYWIKLNTGFFNQDTIDFLLSQKNGCEYVVLYQMLCLKSANNNGLLSTNVGEMLIPYDIDKIVRDTKYFDFDTVSVAVTLYKKLGLIYEQNDKQLKISNFDEMVGSETKWAEKKRIYREKKEALKLGQSKDIVREENRDKSIEIDIDIDNIKENIKENVVEYFSNNIHSITPIEYQKLEYWENEFNEDVIKSAIDISVTNDKRSLAYIEAILKSWKQKGYKTLIDIEKETKSKNKSNKDAIVPSWLGKEIKKEDDDDEFKISDEDKKRFGIE